MRPPDHASTFLTLPPAPFEPADDAPPPPPSETRFSPKRRPRTARPPSAQFDNNSNTNYEPFPHSDYPRGARVAGRVVAVTPAGARVAMLADDRVVGFCAASEAGPPRGTVPAPQARRKKGDEDESDSDDADAPSDTATAAGLAIGDVREFIVLYTPAKARFGGLGPALSARLADEDVLWARAAAVAAACEADGDAVVTTVVGANAGGFLATLAGLPAFVPFSQVEAAHVSGRDVPPNAPQRRGFDPAAAPAAVGATLRALPTDIDRRNSRIILSPRAAAAAAARQAVSVGGLVAGIVSRVEGFGAFVRIEGTMETGLLHVSNISRARVRSVESLFAPGDRIRALVVGMDDDGGRISLSTAEIEATDGDMLRDAQAVYAGAEEQAGVFRAHLEALAAQAASGEAGE